MNQITQSISPLEQPSKELKIFVIEDDCMFREALEYYLSKNQKFKIQSFSTGEECLKHFREQNPDIIILDYRLNEENANAKNGIEVLRKLKLMSPEIPVLMLSAQDNIEIATTSIRNGAFDYIVKNESSFFRLQNLLSKIIHIMNLKESEKKDIGYIRMITIFLSIYVVAMIQTYYFFPDLLPKITASLLVIVPLGITIIVSGKKETQTGI